MAYKTQDQIAILQYNDYQTGDPLSAADANDMLDGFRALANNIDDMHLRKTIIAGGFWGEVVWVSSTQIQIQPKYHGSDRWIGAILNDGKYLEATSAITVKYDTPSNSGHILDGLPKLSNEWQVLYLYEDSGGNLAAGFGWMPQAYLGANNPTTTITLAQVGGTNIGKCFVPGAHVAIFEASNKLETPYAYNNGGALPGTVDVTKDRPKIASTTSTQITLTQSLDVTSFTTSAVVYQVDGFEPLDVSTGSRPSVIGSRGWIDTGIRVLTNSSSNIREFQYLQSLHGGYVVIKGDCSRYSLQIIDPTNTKTIYYWGLIPPDKAGVWYAALYGYSYSTMLAGPHWDTDRFVHVCFYNGGGSGNTIYAEVPVKYRLLCVWHEFSASGAHVVLAGYII